jgi:hypothetical protein
MKTNIINALRAVAIIAAIVVFLPLLQCSALDEANTAQGTNAMTEQGAGSLVEGQVYEVELEAIGNGGLYAAEIELEDDEDIEFSAQVESVAADCSSFTALGGLTVVLDGEDDDNDDGDDDDNDDGDELEICDLAAGMWIEVEGVLGADGLFHAEEIENADEEEIELEAQLENLGPSSFTMLGLTIAFDANTVIDGDEDEEDSDDEDNDDDDDNNDDNNDNDDNDEADDNDDNDDESDDGK